MDQGAAQPELIKDINRARLLEILKTARVISRPELAQKTGLSRTTVGVLADELLQLGLVQEVGLSSSTGGRPPRLLRFNPDAALALGAFLADREWTIVLTDLDAQVKQTLCTRTADDSPGAAIEALHRGVSALAGRVDGARVLPAIGLGTPGLVDVREGVIKTAVDVGWSEVPIRRLAEERLGRRAYVANRSKVGALAELLQGAGRDIDDLIYISIGSGIAAGIVHQRRLYLGANSSAGELGHVTVIPDGPPCPCGNRGCLQQLASGPAIANRARARLREGHAGALQSLAGNRPELLDAGAVLQAAEQGDPLALEIAEEAATYLGIAIANLVNLFNPERVILGGPVGRRGRVLLAPVQAEVRRRAMAYPLSTVQVVMSELGADAAAIGAAALVLQQASELLFPRSSGAH